MGHSRSDLQEGGPLFDHHRQCDKTIEVLRDLIARQKTEIEAAEARIRDLHGLLIGMHKEGVEHESRFLQANTALRLRQLDYEYQIPGTRRPEPQEVAPEPPSVGPRHDVGGNGIGPMPYAAQEDGEVPASEIMHVQGIKGLRPE